MNANRAMTVVFSLAMIFAAGVSSAKDKPKSGGAGNPDKATPTEKAPVVSVDKAYVDQVSAMNMDELKAELTRLGAELQSYNDNIHGQRQDFYQKSVKAANEDKTVKELRKQVEDLKLRIEEVINGLPEVKGVADQINKAQEDLMLCALKRKVVSERMSKLEDAAASEAAAQTNSTTAVESAAGQE